MSSSGKLSFWCLFAFKTDFIFSAVLPCTWRFYLEISWFIHSALVSFSRKNGGASMKPLWCFNTKKNVLFTRSVTKNLLTDPNRNYGECIQNRRVTSWCHLVTKIVKGSKLSLSLSHVTTMYYHLTLIAEIVYTHRHFLLGIFWQKWFSQVIVLYDLIWKSSVIRPYVCKSWHKKRYLWARV